MADRPMPQFGNVLDPDLAWVAKTREAALEPELPIVDPHHHLWDRPNNRYLLPDLLAIATRATMSWEPCSSNAARCSARTAPSR